MSRKTKKVLKLLTAKELEKLSTKNLKAYIQRMHKIHEGGNWDGHAPRNYPKKKVTKNSWGWRYTHAEVKRILAKREKNES